jgi:uncharacterized protein
VTRSNHRRRWAVFVLILYVALCSTGGIYLADGTLHPARRPFSDQESFPVRQELQARGAVIEDVALTAADNAALRGWLIRSSHSNGNAAILLHGLGDNRLGMVGYAELLLAHGFTVLLPDARAHGASGGSLATYGLLERNDIREWVDFISKRTGAACIYGIGESMGAAQLLQSLQAGSRFCAVVAESPFASFREIAYDRMGQPFHAGPWVGRTLLRPLLEIAFLRGRWKYNLDLRQLSPEDAIVGSRVPILLIHGEIDSNIPVRHSRLLRRVNPEANLWEVRGAEHCGAISTAPQEFEQRVLDWFKTPVGSPALSAR